MKITKNDFRLCIWVTELFYPNNVWHTCYTADVLSNGNKCDIILHTLCVCIERSPFLTAYVISEISHSRQFLTIIFRVSVDIYTLFLWGSELFVMNLIHRLLVISLINDQLHGISDISYKTRRASALISFTAFVISCKCCRASLRFRPYYKKGILYPNNRFLRPVFAEIF